MSLAQLARELGRTPAGTRKLLAKVPTAVIRPHGRTQYQVTDLEALKRLTRTAPTPSQNDWLNDYLGGTPHV